MLGLYLNARNFVSTRLSREEKGATAVEYGMIVALIAVAVVAAFTFLQPLLEDLFDKVRDEVLPTTTTTTT